MSHQFSIGDYLLDKSIGSGSTGKVKLARHKDTGAQVAIKIIKKETFKDHPTLLPKVQREIALMRLLNHPNILNLQDVLESEHHIFIVEGYAEHGSLYDVIHSLPRITAIHFFRQMIYGLEYLHTHGICHRDLKPENILLNFANQIWIADFGFACWMPNNVANTSCGSPLYAAPEVIKGIPYDGRIADVWSAGVILYAMLAKKLPFNEDSVRQTAQLIKKGVYTIPSSIDEPFQDLIRRIFIVDPSKRITVQEIKRHPAFRIGLPSSYVFPKPFPLPHFTEPIQITPEDEGAIQCLQQVGFDDLDQLTAMLTSNKPNMAKVFYFMLTQRQNIDSIPWSAFEGTHKPRDLFSGFAAPIKETKICEPSKTGENLSPVLEAASNSSPDPNSSTDIIGFSPNDFDHTFISGSTDRILEFGHGAFHSSSASFYESFENAEAWLQGNISSQFMYSDKHTIQHINITIVDFMALLQSFLLDKGFEFFHPDYEQLVARNVLTNISVTLLAEYENESHLQLTITLNAGQPDIFACFIRRITEVVKNLIDTDQEIYTLQGDPNYYSALSDL